MSTFLDTILADVRNELESTMRRRTPADVRAMIADAPPPRDFAGALGRGFGLIAEIKERSPSVGPMRSENVRDAAPTYAASAAVRAVSVLTNEHHFGMSIERLSTIRESIPQPVLRKDFLLDEYQIREARAFGADAVLLMANVLDAARLRGFFDLTRELGMDALFEVHTHEEIGSLPADARIVGINSRKFKSQTGFVGAAGASDRDFSLDLAAFELVSELPAGTIRVAESGISPESIERVRKDFHAALVGTSLLRDSRGIARCLGDFESAIAG